MAILSGSRGQVVLGVLVVGMLYPFAREIKDMKTFFSLFFGLGLFFALVYFTVSFFISGDNIDRWTGDSLSGGVQGRLELVRVTIIPWLNNPSQWLFGRGAGAFLTLGLEDAYPHNHPIEVITELGLIGFTMYVAILFLTTKYAIEIFRSSKGSIDNRSSATILIGIALFGFLLTLKQGSIHNGGADMMLFIVIARIALLDRETSHADDEAFEHEDDHDYEGHDDEGFDEDQTEGSIVY